MSTDADRDYHMRRATTELDLAYRARGQAAAEAHLRLSALHMARLQGHLALKGEHRLAQGLRRNGC